MEAAAPSSPPEIAPPIAAPIPTTFKVQDPAWAAVRPAPVQPLPAPQPQTEQIKAPALEAKNVRLLGVAFHTYILFEEGDTLMLCDQHALHERLLFEQLQKAYDTGSVTQMMLTPRAIQLSFREYGTFLEHQALLASIGYDAEDFGEQTVRLHGVPLILGAPEAESGFRDALDVLEASGSLSEDKRFDRLLQSACKHAVKGGERLPMEALKGLVEDMLTRDVMPTCPHGRPLMVSLTKQELEKRFGRVQP